MREDDFRMPSEPLASSQTATIAIVLCGGTSRRLSGRDKTRELLAGTTVLDHLLDALPNGWAVICVGEERPTTRSVTWCRESPPGGGPVAGIAAGLGHLEAVDCPGNLRRGENFHAELCVVIGGDMPFAATAVPTLVQSLNAQPELDAVLAADPNGRTQPLLAAYRTVPLRDALPREPSGARLMAVIDALLTGTVACDAEVTLDVDTPEALERARHIVGT
jgi:molybdopterin-guanine dinucleotide biosynthesis protein A